MPNPNNLEVPSHLAHHITRNTWNYIAYLSTDWLAQFVENNRYDNPTRKFMMNDIHHWMIMGWWVSYSMNPSKDNLDFLVKMSLEFELTDTFSLLLNIGEVNELNKR